MGQVPYSTASAVKILVIGDGRLATTLQSVLLKMEVQAAQPPIEHRSWSRRASKSTAAEDSLLKTVSDFEPTHVWLAISDRSIREFAGLHQDLWRGRTVVHFAGSIANVAGIFSAHPLTTFSTSFAQAVTIESFSKIPFVLDLEGPGLSELMPGFKNIAHRLAPDQRAYYHALCSIAGNFTTLLWETVDRRFQSEFGFPPEMLTAFRQQIFTNLATANGASVLTGPLARGDEQTVAAHRLALLENFEAPLLKIYDGFVDLHRTEST